MGKHLLTPLLAAVIAVSAAGHAQTAGVQYQTLYAATANDVISDMLLANKTGLPTKIRVAAGHYVFATRSFNSSYDPSLLPVVSTTIQIIGSDPDTTSFEVQGFTHRFFTVLRAGNLSIYNLTLTGGSEGCAATDCSKAGGGVAYNAGGELDFHNCVLTGNSASQVEGLEFGGGGAILNRDGHFLLDRTTVTGNRGLWTGGALAVLGGTGDIWHSNIIGNEAFHGQGAGTTLGGAIYVAGNASVYIAYSSISGNSLGFVHSYRDFTFGAGIFNAGTITLINSAVTENRLTATNPEEGPAAPGSGGGIFNQGTMGVQNSTVGGNSAGTLGGGIYNIGRLQLQGVTISGNYVFGEHGDVYRGGYPDGCSSDNLQLCVSGGGGIWNEPHSSVTVMQSAFGANEAEDCNGVLISKGRNAVGDSLNCTLTPSPWLGGRPTRDLVNLDLELGELQDNGVPGNVHYPLLANSPLIDTGGLVGQNCTPLDQIGQRRVEGDADKDGAYDCDIGAIEYLPRHP